MLVVVEIQEIRILPTRFLVIIILDSVPGKFPRRARLLPN
jgi:hypothetical protein